MFTQNALEIFHDELNWIHTKTLAFFQRCAMSCCVNSIQTQRHRSAIKRSCRALSDDQQNPVQWA